MAHPAELKLKFRLSSWGPGVPRAGWLRAWRAPGAGSRVRVGQHQAQGRVCWAPPSCRRAFWGPVSQRELKSLVRAHSGAAWMAVSFTEERWEVPRAPDRAQLPPSSALWHRERSIVGLERDRSLWAPEKQRALWGRAEPEPVTCTAEPPPGGPWWGAGWFPSGTLHRTFNKVPGSALAACIWVTFWRWAPCRCLCH